MANEYTVITTFWNSNDDEVIVFNTMKLALQYATDIYKFVKVKNVCVKNNNIVVFTFSKV